MRRVKASVSEANAAFALLITLLLYEELVRPCCRFVMRMGKALNWGGLSALFHGRGVGIRFQTVGKMAGQCDIEHLTASREHNANLNVLNHHCRLLF